MLYTLTHKTKVFQDNVEPNSVLVEHDTKIIKHRAYNNIKNAKYICIQVLFFRKKPK